MLNNDLRQNISFKQCFKSSFLIFIPLFIYFFSYIYLAFYHNKFLLFNTIIHESGKYTLTEVIFFASHFLGHIPIYSALAFYFVGVFLCLTKTQNKIFNSSHFYKFSLLLSAFLIVTFVISLVVFGSEDTFAFILQERQRVGEYNRGGAWNLHLPSTIVMLFLIPVYLYALIYLLKIKISLSRDGIVFIAVSFLIIIASSLFVNSRDLSSIYALWFDPRYQGHSIRELVTYSLTYLPIPLFFFLRELRKNSTYGEDRSCIHKRILYLTLLLLLLVTYQVNLTLSSDFNSLTQKPNFAKNGHLSLSYLLTSHFFEHFLDSVYFSIFSCLLISSRSYER